MRSKLWKFAPALALWLLVARPALSQYCSVHFSMTNAARHVIGEVNTECGWWHSEPWGNWGVSSNFCGTWDGDQFRGFWLEGGHGQWNSCTSNHPRDVETMYYNHDHNGNYFGDDQWQDGEHSYCNTVADIQVDCPMDTDWDTTCDTGGCLALNTGGFGVDNQFLSLYELDPWSPDDFVTTLYINENCCHVNMSCTVGYCSGPVYSAWYPSTWSTNTPVEANVRMRVDYATFTDWAGNCIWLKNIDPRYDCYY